MPIDLATSESDTKAFEQMAAAEAIEATTPAPAAEPTPAAKPTPEPAAEPAKAEPAKAAEPAEPEKPKADRPVPLAALLEERSKRKSLDAELSAAREELARLKAGAAPAKAEEPTAQTDPLAVIERLQSELGEIKQGQQQSVEFNRFQQTVIAKEAEYVRENPDYPKMVDFLKETRVRAMRDGLGMNDQQIAMALAAEARDTARYALENDLNPAEVFARLAVAHGWKAEAPAKAPEEPAKPAPEATAKLETIAKGQKIAKSLTTDGGGAAPANLTLEAIASMSGAEFDQMWKSGKVRSLMG